MRHCMYVFVIFAVTQDVNCNYMYLCMPRYLNPNFNHTTIIFIIAITTSIVIICKMPLKGVCIYLFLQISIIITHYYSPSRKKYFRTISD
jgi:hypothetical protein